MEISEEVFAEMTMMKMNMVRQTAALYAIADELNRIRHCLSDEVGVYDDVIEDTFQIYGMEFEDIEPR